MKCVYLDGLNGMDTPAIYGWGGWNVNPSHHRFYITFDEAEPHEPWLFPRLDHARNATEVAGLERLVRDRALWRIQLRKNQGSGWSRGRFVAYVSL